MHILANEPYAQVGALVLDELHKYARWKSYLKGLYDKAHAHLSVVVTGSARLDVFARGGDSMFGRYELLRLHPLSVGELHHGNLPAPPELWNAIELPKHVDPSLLSTLETFGGFPEPFTRASKAFHTRWSARRTRSLTKERKLYLWDWSQVPDPGARFENLVASHLLKSVHAWNDAGLGTFELNYFRDREHREVDFVLLNKRRPVLLIEAKLSDEQLSPHLTRLSETLGGVPMVQVLRKAGVDRIKGSARVVSADRFLAAWC